MSGRGNRARGTGPEPAPAPGADAERRRFRALVEHVADGIVVVDHEGIIRFANPAAARLFGREPGELAGDAFGFPLVADEMAEVDVVRRGGGTAVAEMRVSDVEWDGGTALLVSVRDVTDRKRAEAHAQALARETAARERAEAEQHRSEFLAAAGALLDSSLDYATILHRLARLIVAPAETLREAEVAPDPERYTPPPLAHLCVIDVVEGEQRLERVAAEHADPGKAEAIARLQRGFSPAWSGPFPGARALRQREPLLWRELDDADLRELTGGADHVKLLREIGIHSLIAVPLIANDELLGALTCVCGDRGYSERDLLLVRDLAQRAALAVANGRLYREARRASQAKSDFLAVVSHELRTPLNAIIGYTDLLRGELSGPLTDRQAEQLGRISDSSHHLLQIVEQILSFARVEAGQAEVHLAPVDLAQLARDVGGMAEPLAERKGLRLELALPSEPAVVETDAGKLRQVLLNLLTNAVKFTEQGEVRLEVQPDGAAHWLRVSDSGIGITEEDQRHVFEPFWQVEQGNRRTAGGTGLGLSVAQRLTELLGGSLALRSRPGQGTTFSICLPAEPENPEDPVAPAAEPRADERTDHAPPDHAS